MGPSPYLSNSGHIRIQHQHHARHFSQFSASRRPRGGPGNRQPRPHPRKDLRFSGERRGKAPPRADVPQLRGACLSAGAAGAGGQAV